MEEVLKYSFLAMRDRKKKAKKGEQVPLRQDLVLSALWDELDELATGGGGQGYVSFRRQTHRTAPPPLRSQPPRTAPPAHTLLPPSDQLGALPVIKPSVCRLTFFRPFRGQEIFPVSLPCVGD